MLPLLKNFLILCLLPVMGTAASPSTDALDDVWRLGAQGLFAEAAEALPENTSEEETVFTRAVLLLNRQPRTDADLANAITMLRDLGQRGGSVELRARSLYYAARAESFQNRDQPADTGSFEHLWQNYPEEPYGQRALVHLMLLAFDAEALRETILARCAELEEQAEGLTDRMVRSHFHQVAARGYLYLGSMEARALEHLLQVSAWGTARRETLGDLHVSIGQLAVEQGRPDLARKHYREFLRLFPNDPRVYTIKANLRELPEESVVAP